MLLFCWHMMHIVPKTQYLSVSIGNVGSVKSCVYDVVGSLESVLNLKCNNLKMF